MASKIHSRCPLSTTTDTCFSGSIDALNCNLRAIRVFVHLCLANLLRSRLISHHPPCYLENYRFDRSMASDTRPRMLLRCPYVDGIDGMGRVLNLFIDVGECEHVTRKTFGNLWKSTIKGYIYITKDVL